jgi:hypothetical protein
MNPLSVVGAFIITLSLLSYGIGSIAIQRFKIVTPGVLIFLSLGVLLDIVAVAFMIIGSSKGVFTLHGVLGYTALLTMIIDLFQIWRFYIENGFDKVIRKSLINYSKFAFTWWVITYITGSVLVIWPIN